MEVLMLTLIGLCGFAIVYGIGRLYYLYKQNKRREEERRAEMQKRLEEMRQASYAKVHKVNSTPIKPKVQSDERKMEMPARKETPSYAPSATQSVQSAKTDDGFFDGMVTGYVVNSLINSLSHKSEDSPVERSVGVSKTESSWGFDDEDSRRSASSSFSSSDSSSSWDSSSSDSGPSSDW